MLNHRLDSHSLPPETLFFSCVDEKGTQTLVKDGKDNFSQEGLCSRGRRSSSTPPPARMIAMGQLGVGG